VLFVKTAHYYLTGGCVVIVTLLLTSTKVSQVTTCLNRNVVRSIAMSAGVELLIDGDLICLACQLVGSLLVTVHYHCL